MRKLLLPPWDRHQFEAIIAQMEKIRPPDIGGYMKESNKLRELIEGGTEDRTALRGTLSSLEMFG
jgi:hypothetical protein